MSGRSRFLILILWSVAVFVAALLPLALLGVGSDDCLLQEGIVQSVAEEAACVRSYDNWSSGVIAAFLAMWAVVGIGIVKPRGTSAE